MGVDGAAVPAEEGKVGEPLQRVVGLQAGQESLVVVGSSTHPHHGPAPCTASCPALSCHHLSGTQAI